MHLEALYMGNPKELLHRLGFDPIKSLTYLLGMAAYQTFGSGAQEDDVDAISIGSNISAITDLLCPDLHHFI